jgi:hypothetical protein
MQIRAEFMSGVAGLTLATAYGTETRELGVSRARSGRWPTQDRPIDTVRTTEEIISVSLGERAALLLVIFAGTVLMLGGQESTPCGQA